jgi:predicted dehydrogenase
MVMTDGIRLLLVSDSECVAALREVAANAQLSPEPHTLPPGSHNFGMVELAALVIIAKSGAELADAIVGVWKKTRHPSKITISTPKGSITVEGDSTKTVEDLLPELRAVIA